MGEISDTSASGGYKKTGVHVLKLTSGERKFIKTQWFIKCLLSCACAAQQAVAVIIGPFPVPLFALCILPCMGHFPYTAINEGRKKGEKSWTFPPPITKREEKREREKKRKWRTGFGRDCCQEKITIKRNLETWQHLCFLFCVPQAWRNLRISLPREVPSDPLCSGVACRGSSAFNSILRDSHKGDVSFSLI